MNSGARSRGARLFWTFVPPLALLFVSERLLLPGISSDFVRARDRAGDLFTETSSANLGVFALGIMPAISAFALVELIAILIPALRRLRHGNPEERAKLDRAARVLAIVLAGFQAFSMAMSLRALSSANVAMLLEGPAIATYVVVPTLIAGFCFTLLVADLVTRQGIVHGIVLISGIQVLVELGRALHAGVGKALFMGNVDVRYLGGLLLALVVPLAATWLALRGSNDVVARHDADDGGAALSPYRNARALALRPWVPIPSSSLAAYTIGCSLLVLPATLANFKLSFFAELQQTLGDLPRPLSLVLEGAVVLVLVLILARFFHRPTEMAELAGRLGLANESAMREEAARARRSALGPTCLYFACMLLAASVSPTSIGVALLPLVVALAMDAAGGIRAAGRSDLVTVWSERRASAVPVLRAALEADGIEVTTSGMAVLSLFQLFVPYAPARLLVRGADAPRAEAILRHLLLGAEAPERRPASAPHPSRSASPSRPRVIGLAALGLVTAAFLGVSSIHATPPQGRAVKRADLVVRLIDDESDVIAKVPDSALPEGFEVRIENAPMGQEPSGMKRTARSTFAVVRMREGETIGAAISRGQAWAASAIALPPGESIAWEPMGEWDEESGVEKIDRVRSFILEGEPILTTADVVDAVASMQDSSGTPDVYVAVTLSDEAGKRFETATAENVNRRIAILVDGEVNSAPVVRARIGGGRISISMGSGDPELKLAQAKKLAHGLAGR